jgi:hypothetical protein
MAGYTDYLLPAGNVIQFAFYPHATSQFNAVLSFPYRGFFPNKMVLANPSSTDYANSYCVCFFTSFITFITFHEYHSVLLFGAR